MSRLSNENSKFSIMFKCKCVNGRRMLNISIYMTALSCKNDLDIVYSEYELSVKSACKKYIIALFTPGLFANKLYAKNLFNQFRKLICGTIARCNVIKYFNSDGKIRSALLLGLFFFLTGIHRLFTDKSVNYTP